MRLSRAEQEIIANIYEKMLTEDMDAGGMMGGTPTSSGAIENEDDFAKGDTRIPYIVGRVQTRKGVIKKRKKLHKKK